MQTRQSASVLGLDISSLQTINDAADMFSDFPDYIIFRAYGSDHTGSGDGSMEGFVTQAKDNGVPSTGYYFATPFIDSSIGIDTDAAIVDLAETQAQQFIDKLESAYGAGNYGDLIPMLDVESYTDNYNNHGHTSTGGNYPMDSGMTAAQLLTFIKGFRDYFFNTTNRRLGFYSNRYFLTDPAEMGMSDAQLQEISDMPLWLAEYDEYYPSNTDPTGAPDNLAGWDKFVLWQYGVIADADTHGVYHAQNKVDHNRTTSVDLLKPIDPPTDVTPTQNGDLLTVTFTPPTAIDYIGSSLYVNGVWRKWATAGMSSIDLDISTFTRDTTYTVQMVSEDEYSDFGYSTEKSILLEPTTTETTTEGAADMPKRTTGITGSSLNSFVVDAGAVYINFGETDERLLGATREGNSFVVEVETRDMEIDGVRQAVKGTKRVISVTATITCNLLELTADNLAIALTGSDMGEWAADTAATTMTHDTITRSREIGTMDYITNIAIVGKVNNTGENFIGLIYNALATGGLEVAMEDENEAAIELTFTGHIDPDDIADDGSFTEAWEIRMPKPPTA
jgi:hypothetical protein